ncbi:MAG: hypothetical protein SCH71_06530 [Desulfobulbaceae bacterium]|nr:hypothetical protein [Desulfobulbaceae bacterium]
MIAIPEGFDLAQLVADLYGCAAPFVAVSFLVAVGVLIIYIFKTL